MVLAGLSHRSVTTDGWEVCRSFFQLESQASRIFFQKKFWKCQNLFALDTWGKMQQIFVLTIYFFFYSFFLPFCFFSLTNFKFQNSSTHRIRWGASWEFKRWIWGSFACTPSISKCSPHPILPILMWTSLENPIPPVKSLFPKRPQYHSIQLS